MSFTGRFTPTFDHGDDGSLIHSSTRFPETPGLSIQATLSAIERPLTPPLSDEKVLLFVEVQLNS